MKGFITVQERVTPINKETMPVNIKWPPKAESVKMLGYVHESAPKECFALAKQHNY